MKLQKGFKDKSIYYSNMSENCEYYTITEKGDRTEYMR